MIVKEAVFAGGASSLENLPQGTVPEIAFVGRSNVGKSSLLNRVTGRRKLAVTSSTPGRTQELNVFRVTLADAPVQELALIDLPGYGFAKFAKKKREYLNRLIVDYISSRDVLKLVCLLNDCRRPPEDDELAIREVAFNAGAHLLVVLTKGDKLKRGEQKKTMEQRAQEFRLEASDLILTGEKFPVTDFWTRVVQCL